MEYPQQRELNVDTLKVIDLDRHVFNTETFHVFLREAAWDVAQISGEELGSVKRQKEEAGETLHTDQLILEILRKRPKLATPEGEMPEKSPGAQLNEIFAWVMDLCEDDDIRESLYMPGAKDFIEGLEQSGAFERGEAMFFTMGTEPLQMLKIMCLGVNKHPYLITQDGNKGQQLADSRNEQGKYVITTMKGLCITATQIELYDDKANSFNGLPPKEEGAVGYWYVADEDSLLPSQRGAVPENVQKVNAFPETKRALALTALQHVHKVDK